MCVQYTTIILTHYSLLWHIGKLDSHLLVLVDFLLKGQDESSQAGIVHSRSLMKTTKKKMLTEMDGANVTDRSGQGCHHAGRRRAELPSPQNLSPVLAGDFSLAAR